MTRAIHQCDCPSCQSDMATDEKDWHEQLNLLMSRLDEQERRWLAGVEAKRLGYGGIKLMSKITGLHVNTIRRGQSELSQKLETRPASRTRLKGGGRKRLEKKRQNCWSS